jgi:hypothetical protein
MNKIKILKKRVKSKKEGVKKKKDRMFLYSPGWPQTGNLNGGELLEFELRALLLGFITSATQIAPNSVF